jgi:L-ascorbate metabolism protein UlaG (beta-lactamase superfamily)
MEVKLKNAVARPSIKIGPDAFRSSDTTSLWWLGGAGFLVNSQGTLIAIDPSISYQPGSTVLSEIGLPLLIAYPVEATEIPRLDFVLYTHTDIDHLAPVTAAELIRTGAIFVGPAPVVTKLSELGVGDDRLRLVKAGDRFPIGVVEVFITRADHAWQVLDPVKHGPPFGADDCCGYLLNTPDGTVWHPGDTILLDEHLHEPRVDTLLLDISRGDFHLGPRDAARLANALGAPNVIPHHYGCYDDPNFGAVNGDPDEVIALIQGGASRVHVLAPGERFVVRRAEHPPVLAR